MSASTPAVSTTADGEDQVAQLLLEVVRLGSPPGKQAEPDLISRTEREREERLGDRRPWLSVVEAGRYAGWTCENGRAPASFYELAARIGVKFNGKWRIHVADLGAEMRQLAVPIR
jgi:hypothetical protein